MNESPPLSVSELTRSIKFQLESRFLTIEVQGEISNFKAQTSGHYYFSLKDSEAQISAVMFRGDAALLKKIPKDGDQVVVKGSLNVYPPTGKYQIVVKELSLAGLGALLLKLEELKIKLLRQGFFKAEHKKPLPKFPKTLGVITSPTGAVIQDILNVLTRRHKGFHVILNPVKVQGEGAAEEIARAIKQMNEHRLCDVMILGRGGGSLEDLWAFNEEIVAQAIFQSHIPIVAAIGHETDHTIADYVADVRAPTPSAAAEIILQESAQLLKHMTHVSDRLSAGILAFLKYERQKLSGLLKHPFFASPYALLGPWMQRLDSLHTKIEGVKPSAKITHMKNHLYQLFLRMDTLMINQLKNRDQKLNKTVEILKAIDPKNLLTKGYAILFSEKEKSVIKSVRSLQKNQTIRLLLADGAARSTVTDIETL